MKPKNCIAAITAGVLYFLWSGAAIAANANWLTVDTTYGTNGLSATLAAVSYTASAAIDPSDSTHAYQLVSQNPSNCNGSCSYPGPYSIVRFTSTGAIDVTYGAAGLATTFNGSADSAYIFQKMCVDPVTHQILLLADHNSGSGQTVIIERLLAPASNGTAALDSTFGTGGVVAVSGMQTGLECSVQGDESVIVVGHDASTPIKAVVARLGPTGAPDGAFGTGGLVTFTPPNGQNWEGAGGIAFNGSQTVNPDIVIVGDTWATGNPSGNVAAMIAFDRCTGAPDASFNGTGFIPVPTIDTFVFKGDFGLSIRADGHLVVGLAAPTASGVSGDLVEWPYPATATNYLSPTYPLTLTTPSGVTFGQGGRTSPIIQADGSILLSLESSANHSEFAKLVGTATLGFTAGVPAVFSCGTKVSVPNVVGLTQSAATTAITNAGLAVGTTTPQSSSTVASGSVISESPAAGTQVTSGSQVNLVVSSGPGQVTVPNVVGLTLASATTAIQNASLAVGTTSQQASSTVAPGAVISESPSAGTSVTAGSAVALVVSSGPPKVAVPNVVGQTQAAASTAITGAGLLVGTVTPQASNTIASGSVISESPVANTQVNTGSAVNLVVSSGPGQVAVPNVVGQTQAAAATAISGAGLVLGTVTQASSGTVAAGSVISENPAAGTSVTLGSSVALVVSSGPAMVSVPNVVGQTQSAATAALTGAGLVLGTVTQQTSLTIAAGSVIDETPAAGTSVVAGSAVALTVSLGVPVTVPNVVGDTQAAAATALTAIGLAVGTISQQTDATVPAGAVISSNPAAGASAAPGSVVALTLSLGPPVSVPNVVGDTQAAATTAITGAGLALGAVTQQASSSVASGDVISENPAAGTSVAANTAVAIVVSSGPPPSGGHGGAFDGLSLLLLGAFVLGFRRLRKAA